MFPILLSTPSLWIFSVVLVGLAVAAASYSRPQR